MNRFHLLVVVVCVGLAGCPTGGSEATTTSVTPVGESPTETPDPAPTETYGTTDTPDLWNLDVFVENLTSVDGELSLSTTLAIGGKFSGELHGVEYQLLDRNRTVIREVPVGNVSAGERQWANLTVPESTRYVVVRVDEVTNPDGDYRASVTNLELTPDGEIEFWRTYGKENFTY